MEELAKRWQLELGRMFLRRSGDGEERNLALALFPPAPQRGNLVRGCSMEVLPKTLVEKQSSGNWTLFLFLRKKMLKAGVLHCPFVWCVLNVCYLL